MRFTDDQGNTLSYPQVFASMTEAERKTWAPVIEAYAKGGVIAAGRAVSQVILSGRHK